MPPPILPPLNVAPQPDKATQIGLQDFTGNSADKRVLHINLGFIKYGTNDKSHAAAIVLSIVLLLTIIGVIFIGVASPDLAWKEKIFNWLGGAFLFVSGVALGGKSNQDSDKKSDDDC